MTQRQDGQAEEKTIRYEWTNYETAKQERAMLHDRENDRAWIDSSLVVAVER